MNGYRSRHEELTVPVAGGALTVLRWPAADPAAPVVLAVHGITANGLAWSEVAGALAGRVTLLAPDLRGRGASRTLGGPYGLARHADDMAELISALGLGPTVLAGHSMGAWIAALTAVRHPALVRRLLLVDGAVSLPLPAGVPPQDALAAVLGPALARLSMSFADRDAYRTFWRKHPAFGGAWSSAIEAYIQRDLIGAEPELRSSCVLEAVRADGAEVLLDPDAAAAVHRLPCTAELLLAERGLLDEAQALYDEERIAAAGLDPDRVTSAAFVPDTNHYSILRGGRGADTVARRLLGAAG
ncbi:alpha/beta fold hydrolase [Kitasatospora sp. NPDC050543]|uniref:alpha/beta fold hydrolase n=1 Tax=Kitasatospora sp. NPDC050543 TaxID=3364054 RepID=UPI00379651A3